MNIEATVEAELRALLAGNEAAYPGYADQVRYLRCYLEAGLDELEQAEGDYYDFLTTCANLAGENMQDARLWSLEAQVDELQNPRVTVEDLLTEAVVLLVGELLVIGGFYYAVPAVLVMLRNRSLAKAARRLTGALAEDEKLLSKLGELSTSRTMHEKIVAEMSAKIRTRVGRSEYQDLEVRLRTSSREVKRVRDEQIQLRAALQTSREAADAAVAARKGTTQLGEKWKPFFDNIASDTIVGRAAEQFGPDIEKVLKELPASDGGSYLPFETSSVIGAMLSIIQRERVDAWQEWAELRLYVRFLDDVALLASERVQELLRRILTARPELAAIQVFGPVAREGFVRSFELILWLDWFKYNTMLGVVRNVEIDAERRLAAGQIFQGKLVTAAGENTMLDPAAGGPTYWAVGDFYPAIPKLNNDELAIYLYNKFARDFFVRNPTVVPLPKPYTFDARRYDEVPAMPKDSYVVFDNADRAKRLDEMRLMIAVYFNGAPELSGAGFAKSLGDLLRQLLGLDPESNPLQQWLDGRPPIETPEPFPEPLPGEQGPVADLAAPIEAMLRDAGVEQKWLVGDARSQLETAVTDLDLKISLYPLQHPPTSSPTLREDTAEDAAGEIEDMQIELDDRYARFLELAAEQPELVAEVKAAQQDRVHELTMWSPAHGAELAWHWPANEDGDVSA